VSPDEGRKGAGKGGGGAAAPFASRRALLAFGILFVVLFTVVAIAEGLGDPSVPAGDAALVEDAPGDIGKITEAEVDHAIELAAASGEGAQKTPKPGDPEYEELKEAAMQSVLEGVWIRGLADEEGIEVTEREVERQVRKVKKESFQSEAEFQKFLKESSFTPDDVDTRIEIEMLSERLQNQLAEEAPKPTEREIEDYYEAAKATQFTTQPSVDVRLIVNKDEQKAEEAKKALVADNTAKNWSKVAKEFSEDVATKEKGGLQKGLQEGVTEEPLDAAFFDTPEGQVEGPLDSQRGYTVFEVVSSTPGGAQELKVAEPQIKSTLEQRLEQEFFTEFISTNFNAKWRSRTFCAPDYVTEQCANFKPSGPPAGAPKACYEEDPKGGLPEACPAPVFQLEPALPGSVTPLEPQGKPLAQRPVPGEEAGGAPEAPTGLPEGVPPPETAPEEAPSE
jgi:parvulin-like peptidyl-prolyl isomerase